MELHIAVFLFSLSAVLAQNLLLNSGLLVFLRSSIAALALGVRWIGNAPNSPTRQEGVIVAALGFFLMCHWTTFFHAISLSGVPIAAVSFSIYPVFIVIFEHFYRQVQTPPNWKWALICLLLGVAVIVLDQESLWGRSMVGIPIAFLSGLCFAFVQLLGKELMVSRSSQEVCCFQNISAALWTTPFAAQYMRSLTREEWFYVICLGVICTAVAHTWFLVGMRKYGNFRASVVSAFEPFYACLTAAALSGELPGLHVIIGGGFIFLSTLMTIEKECYKDAVRPF